MHADEPSSCGNVRRYRLRRSQRVLRKADFERGLTHGRRASDAQLTVWLHPNGLPHARLGLVVGRRVGGAVRRNRLKRVLRSAFRLLQYELSGGFDVLIAPRPRVDLDLAGAHASLVRLVARLARRR